jgi:hypothetical protein
MSTPMAPITAGGQAFCDVIAEVTCARSQRGHTNMAPTRAQARVLDMARGIVGWHDLHSLRSTGEARRA